MIACPQHNNKRSASPASGFTLVEMMVALAIGLFLLGGLISLLVSTSVARTELDKSSRQIENGRYAMQLLSADIMHAGFLGTYSPSGAAAQTPDPCETVVASLGFSADPLQLPVFVQGYDGSAADPSCVTNRIAGTDVLVVRRVSTTSTPAASPVANEVYFQSSFCVATPMPTAFVIGTSGFDRQLKDCATAAPLNKYMVRVYYVSSCNICSPSDNIPTLKVAEYVLGAMTVTPLVEGIQNLQVDYGIDMDGDGAPDCYISNPDSPAAGEIAIAICPNPAAYVWTTAAQNWSNVVSVRIHVLARNNETSGGWTDTRTYNLGLAGTAGPFNDNYKRHAYSAVARVVNVSGRRETP